MPDVTKDVANVDPCPRTAATTYRAWDWPVTLRHDQISLDLRHEAVALIIPTLLATDVTRILRQRRCPTPVLAHPYVPEHRVLLAGEQFGVALPWPSTVHRVTGSLLLPPTATPRGPVTWVQPPEPHALRLSREIDLLGALRTALAGGLGGAGELRDPLR